ncbi:MAG: Transcriptional regulatory protein ZraR [bacterium ADurb.Bin431]|nr:MAG: Transcriptional regulatory protein ZraR [bacterium ADurb.Bin431]HNY89937.1 sigma-54 dependent transcriptional regulator [bacterium]
MAQRVLIVEDDDITREILVSMLVSRGFACDQASNGQQALEMLGAGEYDVVVTDISMPLMTGIELMEKSAELNLRASFIIITAYASLETALEALRKGAYDYLLKPLNFEDVAIKVKKLLEHKELVQENQALRQEINAQYDFSNIIGKSPAIRKLFATIRKVSDSDSHVLITGNSGTGKELVAKAIHYNSPRRKGRFVAINCGAITETLMESELFGHKRGSFTGAVVDKDGLFKVAHNGTLFLDEIGDMSLTGQAKLLRALENREILPVGATAVLPVNVRTIAATNHNLWQEVQAGRFREDLYFRLNVIEIHIPSLRERPSDIPLLVDHFIQKYNRQMNRHVRGADPGVLEMIVKREWKGEVRELENFIERLMIFTTGEVIAMEDLPGDMQPVEASARRPREADSLRSAMEQYEREFIREQLIRNHYHRGRTAAALKIGEATLYRKMNEYGLSDLE